MTVCLDSWAVLAWLDGDEPACGRVGALIAGRPVMSWVNAVEVYHRVERDHGRGAADEVLAELRRIVEVELPGVNRMLETARMKAALPIALGDCFALATAAARGLPLTTGDPEILGRPDLPCATVDLR
ncbi:MAG: PIN domain-containing protein [Candidatus Dormibacteria bacterium]